MPNALDVQAVLTILSCCGYLVASSQLVLLNKFLFKHDNFHYPLLLSCMGMCFTFVASSCIVRVTALVPRQQVSIGSLLTSTCTMSVLTQSYSSHRRAAQHDNTCRASAWANT
jgi:hypothetical protein